MPVRKKETLLSVLDIGSAKISAGVCRIAQDQQLTLIGAGVVPTRGIRNGGVVDLEELAGAVRDAVEEVEKSAKTRLGRPLVGVTSRDLKSFNSSGSLLIGQSPQAITQANFQKCVEAARNISLSPPLDVLHCLVRQCLVDETMEVDNPIGMVGKRMEVGLQILALPRNQLTHFTKAVNQAGLAIDKLILQSVASAEASLYPEEKEYGTLFVDIGACTTTAVVFQRGNIQHCFSIPVGGEHFTRDIVVGLRTTLREAERVKCRFGLGDGPNTEQTEPLEIQSAGSGQSRQISPQILKEIIQPRTDEILELIRTEISLAGIENNQFASMVLSGGGALLHHLVPYAEKFLDIPCRMGMPIAPEGWPGELVSPAYTGLLGLCLKARNARVSKDVPIAERVPPGEGKLHRATERFKNWFQELTSI